MYLVYIESKVPDPPENLPESVETEGETICFPFFFICICLRLDIFQHYSSMRVVLDHISGCGLSLAGDGCIQQDAAQVGWCIDPGEGTWWHRKGSCCSGTAPGKSQPAVASCCLALLNIWCDVESRTQKKICLSIRLKLVSFFWATSKRAKAQKQCQPGLLWKLIHPPGDFDEFILTTQIFYPGAWQCPNVP